MFRNFSHCREKGIFSCVFKNADVVPVHSDKGGYRPCEYPP